MRTQALGAALLLVCCADVAPPEVCLEMCQSAQSLYGRCLSEWGLDWPAAGYLDADDFLGSCETWGWEAMLLERDAVRSGNAARGAVAQACDERDARYSASDATCEDWVSAPWSALPWEG